jgi:hypothetical protein
VLTQPGIAAKWRHDHLFSVADGAAANGGRTAMISFLARFVGLWLIAGALVALVIDGTKTIAASALSVTPLGRAWFVLSPGTLVSAQQFVQQKMEAYIGHWLWDPLIQWLLMLPTWAVFGVLGGWLAYVGSRRRRLKTAFA